MNKKWVVGTKCGGGGEGGEGQEERRVGGSIILAFVTCLRALWGGEGWGKGGGGEGGREGGEKHGNARDHPPHSFHSIHPWLTWLTPKQPSNQATNPPWGKEERLREEGGEVPPESSIIITHHIVVSCHDNHYPKNKLTHSSSKPSNLYKPKSRWS